MTDWRRRRTTNDQIRAESAPQSGEPIAFICEGGQDICFRPAWLTAEAYDELCGSAGFVTCSTHAHSAAEVLIGIA